MAPTLELKENVPNQAVVTSHVPDPSEEIKISVNKRILLAVTTAELRR
jgi:hypothetical protein